MLNNGGRLSSIQNSSRIARRAATPKQQQGGSQVVSHTCCRLRDVDLWGLLLLGQQGRHAAQLGEAAAAAAGGGQASTLRLLGLHLTYVGRVGGRGGLGAQGGSSVYPQAWGTDGNGGNEYMMS